MPKKPPKAKEKRSFRFSEEQLQMSCEWRECNETFDSMRNFLWHIVHHQRDRQNDDMVCEWRGCGYLAENEPQFVVHVNFHAFHAKIKSIGANLLDRKELEGCSLSSHGRNMVPELPDRLTCDWVECKLSFDNPELFYQHGEQHVDSSEKDSLNCRWEGCEWTFKEAHRLREHIRTHTQEKMIACPNCGSLFANRTKFHDHLRRQTPMEEQKYRCSHCSKILASERFLRDHMRNHINNYKCLYCDMTCSTPSTLRNHVMYRHTTERSFECKFCDYSGKTLYDLRKHVRMHIPKASFDCPRDGCEYTANNKLNLTMHLKQEHEEDRSKSTYNCHLCDKKLTRGAFLTRHLIGKHKFQLPSGHSRFRYKRNDDGNYQLQTIRYESIELTQEMIDRDAENDLVVDEDVEEDLNTIKSQRNVDSAAENQGKGSKGLDTTVDSVLLLSITKPDGKPIQVQLSMSEEAEVDDAF